MKHLLFRSAVQQLKKALPSPRDKLEVSLFHSLFEFGWDHKRNVAVAKLRNCVRLRGVSEYPYPPGEIIYKFRGLVTDKKLDYVIVPEIMTHPRTREEIIVRLGRELEVVPARDGETPRQVALRCMIRTINKYAFKDSSQKGTYELMLRCGIEGMDEDNPFISQELGEEVINNVSQIRGLNVVPTRANIQFMAKLRAPLPVPKHQLILAKISQFFRENPSPIYNYGFELRRRITDGMVERGCKVDVATVDVHMRRCHVAAFKEHYLALAADLQRERGLPTDDVVRTGHDINDACAIPDFEYEARESFVSGTNSEGVFAALNATVQSVIQPPFAYHDDVNQDDLNDVTLAFIEMMRRYAPKIEDLFDAPKFTKADAGNIGFDPSKSAGYSFRRIFPTGDEDRDEKLARVIGKRVTTIRKGHSFLQEANALVDLFMTVKKDLMETGLQYSRRWFPILVSKIALKSEIRNHDVDKKKVRMFFIVCFLKYLIDKYIYSGPFYRMFGQYEVGIGFSRTHGEYDQEFCQVIKEEWKKAKEPTSVMDGDLHKMDQTMLAVFLNWIFMLPLFFYKPDESKTEEPSNYQILRAFMAFSADDIAVSLIKWIGMDYRWIIGVMFSGLFGTSMGDTLYAIWAKTGFKFHAYRRLTAYLLQTKAPPEVMKKDLQLFKEVAFAKKYGDDLFEHIVTRFLWLYCRDKYVPAEELMKVPDLKPDYMQSWYKRNFNLNLKMAETRIFTHELPWTTRVSTKFDVVVEDGPVYLKRRAVMRIVRTPGKEPEVVYYPYRVTNDYIAKACNTTSLESSTSQSYWVAKWRGLMLDTCGTNTMAYAFLRYLHDFFMDEWKGLGDILRADLDHYQLYGVWPRTGGDIVPLLRKLEMHYDMEAVQLMRECPSQAAILAKYKVDKMYLNQRAQRTSSLHGIRQPMVLMAAVSSYANLAYPCEQN